MLPESSVFVKTEDVLEEGATSTGKDATISDARQGASDQHNLSVTQALRQYPSAVAWSVLVSMTVVMIGYDAILINSFIGYPSFREKYGHLTGSASHGYQISAPWQVAIALSVRVGNFIGILLSGHFTTVYGYRPVLLASLFLSIGLIFILFFAPNIQAIFVGEFLCGIPWGTFAAIGPAYASEVCPLALRGYLIAYTETCFVIGQIICAGVLQSLLSRNDEWSYRIPFALQWIWPLPLSVLLWFAPESPWWLVRQGFLTKAEATVTRLSNGDATSVMQTVAQMVHTDNIEKERQSGTLYWDCFKGIDLRRTEIASVALVVQVISGGVFAYNATYFFEQAGISAKDAYKLNLGGTGLALVGCIFSWYLISRFGRRSIFITGLAVLCICLAVIGFSALAPADNTSIRWIGPSFALIWIFVFSATVGPLAWVIPAEVSSTRLRARTVSLARSAFVLASIASAIIEPYMLSPEKWNWKGKTGFFWTMTTFLSLVWAYFRLPETKDRTFEEIDLLFERRISARDFTKTHISAYEVSI